LLSNPFPIIAPEAVLGMV